MRPDPAKRHRRSPRLRGYDYSLAGAYLVTICTHERDMLFGEVADGELVLSEFGMIVEDEWVATEQLRPSVELDHFIIMPSHVHGIIVLAAEHERRDVARYVPATTGEEAFRGPRAGSLGAIVRSFKSSAAKRVNAVRGTPGHPVWQGRYHDHVIRDEKDLGRVRTYIVNNPLRWQYDRENRGAPSLNAM